MRGSRYFFPKGFDQGRDTFLVRLMFASWGGGGLEGLRPIFDNFIMRIKYIVFEFSGEGDS